jgi:trehalose 6-phosphate phosphatase
MSLTDPIDAFLRRLPGAPAALLALDYDGTLAPFRVERDRATPLPGMREALDAIRRETTTRLVIVSGRPCAILVRLLGLDPAPEVWGSHGWEHRLADGSQENEPLPPVAQAAATALERALVAGGFDDLLERKASGVALHWRGVPPERAAAARAAVERVWETQPAAHGPLQLLAFDNGVEIRGAGRDKGTALRSLLGTMRPDAAVAYAGDDLTDEDAFAALPAGGLGVLVAAVPRATRATARVSAPADLLGVLERWRRVAAPRPASAPRAAVEGSPP